MDDGTWWKRRLSPEAVWGLLGVLLAILAITLPELGSDPWPFRPHSVEPSGPFAALVRAADEQWDVGISRSVCFLAALAMALLGAFSLRRRSWPMWTGVGLVVIVALALMVPSTALQLGLRDSTAQWFFTNDSTYQIEIAGDLVLHGHNPYGHDYSHSGMERFYSFDGSTSQRVREREVALHHYAYFPGTAITAAVWRAITPGSFGDYRLFVLIATLLGLAAALCFRGPPGWRLAIGAFIAANPIAVRSAWFGQNDAPSILLCVLAFALLSRGRYRWAVASLAGAVLLKQFAVIAIPFIVLMLLARGLARSELKRLAGIFVAILAVGLLPFFVADPGAFWDDTVRYGAGTYKIVGYGLSAMLVRGGIVADHDGAYPFGLIALVTWLPLTIWLLAMQYRSREQWIGPAGFSISLLVLMFIGRTFNNYYLVWPMIGGACAALTYLGERAGASPSHAAAASSSPPSPVSASPT